MPRPVFVIHGIGVRNPGKFFHSVDSLDNALGDDYELIPVFWGDLGASDEHMPRVIARYPNRSRGARSMMADRLAGSLAKGLGKTLSWASRKRGDEDAAALIAEHAQQVRDDMKVRVRGYINDKFQDMRGVMTTALLPFLADVIAYQGSTQRSLIHQRFREVIDKELGPDHGTPAKPLTVIAHSLGGVITFDMATVAETPLCLNQFITLGSQPAFFHVLDRRSQSLDTYNGSPVTLPDSIGSWTNIWDELDVLAFGAGEVFRLHDGSIPADVPVRCYRDPVRGAALLPSHLGYFTRRASVTAIAKALKNAEG